MLVGEVKRVHDEGVVMWIKLLQIQKKVEEACQRKIVPPVLDTEKGKGVLGAKAPVKENNPIESVILDITSDMNSEPT